MGKHLLHWYTPDWEAGPGTFVPAGEPYVCEGGPLDGKQMGVVDPTFRLWYAMRPDGRWSLATTEDDVLPEVLGRDALRGHYAVDVTRRVMTWQPVSLSRA